jgi:hypothetical protein
MLDFLVLGHWPACPTKGHVPRSFTEPSGLVISTESSPRA